MKTEGTLLLMARGVFRNRKLRRKMMAAILLILLLVIALGTWVVDDWLAESILRFVVFWLIITVYTLVLLLLCVYDMLRLKKECMEESE